MFLCEVIIIAFVFRFNVIVIQKTNNGFFKGQT